MFEPKYRITNSVLLNLIRLERELTLVDKIEDSDEVNYKLRTEARTSNILHLAHLIELNLTLKVASKIALGKSTTASNVKHQILLNYRNTNEYIRSTIPSNFGSLDVSMLLHLNKIILTNWRDVWEARFRRASDNTSFQPDSWTELSNKEIVTDEVQTLTLEIINWYVSNQAKIHPILRIAIVIYHLIRISPFLVANRLTVLAILEYLFYQTPYLMNEFLPIVRVMDIYESEYLEAWKVANDNYEDMTLWLERFCRNLTNEFIKVRERVEVVVQENKSKVQKPFLDLNKRQLKILRYLQNIPTIKREDYVQMMSVSTMTAFRDLNDLVKKKLLKVDGQGRATKYYLTTR